MTEEEKKTIEEVKYFISDGIDEARPFPIDDWCQTLLNLIEKQQKEIESMAEFIWKYDCCEHFKKEDENFKCEGWYINRECRENCIQPFFKKRWEE